LKCVTGAKLIVELMAEPGGAQRYDHCTSPPLRRVKALLYQIALHIVAPFTDRFKLLYPSQLQPFPLLRAIPFSVFHDFVPTMAVRADVAKEEFILLVGYPWYIKGADILIKAFRLICAEFPHARLKILGHIPIAAELSPFIGDCDQVDILRAVPHAEALSLIERALIVAHPARTEGMGRVLLEAMSAKAVIVATEVGGIPHYIRDQYNGLLCPPENPLQLAHRLRLLLSDQMLRRRLADNAYELVQTTLSEEIYVQQFYEMLRTTTRSRRRNC
jgi:glycosyltransferase involved in cell wall biosynthesis